jgi:hypothetical protein
VRRELRRHDFGGELVLTGAKIGAASRRVFRAADQGPLGRRRRGLLSRGIVAAALAVLLSSLFLAVTPASSLAQNLILNPSFEEGDYPIPDWSQTGDVDTEPSGEFGIPAYSGNYYANPYATGGTLAQTVGISKSGTYEFSFFYATEPGQTWSLTSTVNGASVFSATVATNGSYDKSSSILKLSTSSAAVLFDATYVSGTGTCGACTGTYGEFAIDDVSLILISSLLLPSNASTDQRNVAGAIDSFTGTPPSGFFPL